MKYFLTYITCLLTFNSFGQNPNTLFVNNKSDGDIKMVYNIGNKLNVEYINQLNEVVKIKGEISAIEMGQITVDNQVILISQIVSIKSHIVNRKIIGGALALSGVGIAIAGQNIGPSGTMFDFSSLQKGLWTFVGGAIAVSSTFFLLVLPKKFNKDKFEFRIYEVS